MKTAEEILTQKPEEMVFVGEDTTLADALQEMRSHRIGAIVVKRGEEIVGIWTERDLISDILEEGFDPGTEKISKYMSTDLKYAEAEDSLYKLQDKFLGMRLRHLLVRKEGRVLGILSAGDVMKSCLNEKEKELKELNAMVGWEYYENWRWDRKR